MSLVNAAAWRVTSSSTRAADRAQLLDLVETVGRRRADADRELLLQARDAHLEELVEVAAEDREELGALEQRERRVLGVREHPCLEVEHRQLAVEVAGASAVAASTPPMVGAPGRTSLRALVAGSGAVPRRYAAGTDTRGRLESTTFTPFARLALAHAIGVAGDVFVTVSLAGTLFFDVAVGAAAAQGRRCTC